MKRSKQSRGKERSNNRGNRPVATVGLHAKNEVVIVNMVGLTHDGDGVGRTEQGYTLFVPYALPHEQVEAKVLKSKKHYGYAKLLEIEQVSPERVEATCPIY